MTFQPLSHDELIAMRQAIHYLEGTQTNEVKDLSEELDAYTMYGLFRLVVTLFDLKGFYIKIDGKKKAYVGLTSVPISEYLEIPLNTRNGRLLGTTPATQEALFSYNYFLIYSDINQCKKNSPIHYVLEEICHRVSFFRDSNVI
jgi:hypothetical protein